MASARSLSLLDRLLFGGTLLFVLIFAVTTDALRRIDLVLYDSMLRLVPVQLEPNLVIVAIDESSLAELGQWPWPRQLHAQLLQTLQQAGARAVVFDVLFTEPDRYDPEMDAQLAEAMQQFGQVILPLHLDQLNRAAPLTEILPHPQFATAAAQLGHAHVELDSDGIARGLYLYQGAGRASWPALSLAALLQVEPSRSTPFPNQDAQAESAWFNVRKSYKLIPFVGGAGSVPTYGYSEALASQIPADLLRDKIIFVGATAAGMGDLLPTPYSGAHSPMPGVEVHANAFNALLQNSLIETVPSFLKLALSLLIALFPILLFPRLSPERNLPFTAVLAIGVALLSYALLTKGWWFGPAPLLATLMLAYPLWSWRRLARLNRFLGQELQRLSQEPALSKPVFASPLQEWYLQLVALLEPSTHAFYEGEASRVGDTLPDKFQTQQLPERQWIKHQGYWCYCINQASAPRVLMVLGWNAKEIGAIDQLLPTMTPPLAESLPPPYRRTEVIERRIQQVRTALASLRTMRQFIGDSFENMPDGIMVTDRLGQILFANGHCLRWFQHQQERHPDTLLSWLAPYTAQGPFTWPQLARQVLIENRDVTAELRLPDRELLVQLVPFAATESHDSGLIASFSDITRLREEQRRRLETVDFVSHDLRAPLVSQMALLEQLLEDETPARRELLQRARRYTQKSLQLADQFLQLTRVEAADEIQLYECDLLAVLENAVDQVRDQALAKDINVVISEDSEEAWMMGNAELLERVAVNLLTNAIKYSSANTCITTSVTSDARHLVLKVEDQGYGMDEQAIATMFDRFRLTPRVEQQQVTSAGLGLRFVKIVVERHQGRIDVQSVPNQGTTVRLLFPCT